MIGKLIAGDLSFHENVIGHVVLNGLNNPVAIAEGSRIGVVALRVEPVIGVAGDMKPETSPALAIARRGEQTINDFGERIGRAIVFKCINLFGRGREAGEIVGGASTQRAAIGATDRVQPARLELCREETVNLCAGPIDIFHVRSRHRPNGLQGPEGALFRGDLVRRRLQGGFLILRPNSAGSDPLFDSGDLVGGQFAGGWHLGVCVVVQSFH